MNSITEGLRPNDLEHLVSNYISIDQYTSKIDDDNITVAFFCNEQEVASDLRDFIEKIYFPEIKDIEISDSITEDDKYIVFVELERNIMFPKILIDIIDSVSQLNNIKEWFFKTFKLSDKVELTSENIKKYVRLQKLREVENAPTEESPKEEVKESVDTKYETIEIKDDGFTRKYTSIGYITESTFNHIVEESDTLIRDPYEMNLLENHFLGCDIITTDVYTFVIKEGKILALR